jgi:hypothetical protein
MWVDCHQCSQSTFHEDKRILQLCWRQRLPGCQTFDISAVFCLPLGTLLFHYFNSVYWTFSPHFCNFIPAKISNKQIKLQLSEFGEEVPNEMHSCSYMQHWEQGELPATSEADVSVNFLQWLLSSLHSCATLKCWVWITWPWSCKTKNFKHDLCNLKVSCQI